MKSDFVFKAGEKDMVGFMLEIQGADDLLSLANTALSRSRVSLRPTPSLAVPLPPSARSGRSLPKAIVLTFLLFTTPMISSLLTRLLPSTRSSVPPSHPETSTPCTLPALPPTRQPQEL